MIPGVRIEIAKWLVGLTLSLGCTRAPTTTDTGADAPSGAADTGLDAPPPTIDAPFVPFDSFRPPPDTGPPLSTACSDAGTCELPPSTCLDREWLVYYESASSSCDDAGTCSFTTRALYCFDGCVAGGCDPGFT